MQKRNLLDLNLSFLTIYYLNIRKRDSKVKFERIRANLNVPNFVERLSPPGMYGSHLIGIVKQLEQLSYASSEGAEQ